MRVAYIGNLGEGSAPHSTENHVARALETLGITVHRIHEQRFNWDARALPRQTDWVLWTHTHGFAPKPTHRRQAHFLEALRRRSIPIVSYHLDRWWDLQREYQITEEPFFRTSLVCTADGGNDRRWAEAGVEHVWFPPAVSRAECEPGTPRDEYRADLAFVGSWQGGYHAESRHRAELVDWLRSTYPDAVFWPRPAEHAVRGQDLRDLYASVKVLVGDSCFSGDPRGAYYSSDRIPETIGRGGLLVHPETKGVTDGTLYTAGEHLFTWPAWSWDALRYYIDSLLVDADLRAYVAAHGREHVLTHHTYERRMVQLLDLMAERGLIERQAVAA
jgi:Glycosyl transferases group 1